MERFAEMYARSRVGGARLVDGHHPARVRPRQRARDRQPRRSRAATSAARARGSCRSAATPACRAAPRWARTRPRSRAASPSTPESAAALSAQYGLPGARRARGSRPRRWSRPPAAASSTCSTRAAATSSTCCPIPRLVADASAACPCACTRTSWSRARCSSTPRARRWCCCPPPRATSSAGGGTETTTERRIAFSPEIRGPRPGEARTEWEIFVDLARRVRPGARRSLVAFADGQAIRDEIARVVPFYDGIEHLRDTGDQVQWGGARLCDGWVFPTADGKAHFTPVAPREPRPPAGRFAAVDTARQAVQLDGLPRRRPAHRGGSRRPVHGRRGCASVSGLRDGAAVRVRSEAGEVAARVHVAPRASGQRPDVLPGVQSR